jgi:hypothetical protein
VIHVANCKLPKSVVRFTIVYIRRKFNKVFITITIIITIIIPITIPIIITITITRNTFIWVLLLPQIFHGKPIFLKYMASLKNVMKC